MSSAAVVGGFKQFYIAVTLPQKKSTKNASHRERQKFGEVFELSEGLVLDKLFPRSLKYIISIEVSHTHNQVIFRKLIVRVIDITFEGAEPPRRLYQLRVHQFSKCFVSWPNQKLEYPPTTVTFQNLLLCLVLF